MTSQVNPNNIDGSYPVAGQDNNSQGFRDNFTNIKVNFQYTEDEITDLQNFVVLKGALPTVSGTPDNNMNDTLIYAAKIQDFSATKVTVSPNVAPTTTNIVYSAGHYQTITPTSPINLSFTTFPATGSYGYVRIQFNITNTSYTVQLPATVSLGLAGIQGISPGTSGLSNTITFSSTGYYEFGFSSSDGGTTITVFDLNRALTNFTSFSVSSFTATGNVVGGNIITAGTSQGAIVSATGNVVGGNITTGGQVVATGNITGGNITARLRPPAQAANVAPLQFTSATYFANAASAGTLSYDGNAFYAAATANQGGVIPATLFMALTNNYTGSDVNTAQKVFDGSTNGAVTLAASTTYFMEAVYYITRAAGTTSHTLSTLFALGGSLTSIAYTADTTSTTGNVLGAVSRIYATGATGTAVTAASTSATENITVKISGIVRTNAAGTFTPQIQYSAAPGGAPTILANSYLKLVPVGSSTVSAIGNWS
jgi:hypothetical protein